MIVVPDYKDSIDDSVDDKVSLRVEKKVSSGVFSVPMKSFSFS